MRLKLKYFLLVYVIFMNFLKRNDLKSIFRKTIGYRSILWYIRDEKLLEFVPALLDNVDYRDRWQYRCKIEESCIIYHFLQFLCKNGVYRDFRVLHTNHYQRNIEEYLTTTDKREFILTIMRQQLNTGEYSFWSKYHILWNKEYKTLMNL